MSNRLRTDVQHLFIAFAEVYKPASGIPAKWSPDHWKDFVLRWHPETCNTELLRRIPEFSFPCEVTCATKKQRGAELYSFTFTDEEGKFIFGYCRRNGAGDNALVILSALPWFEIFTRLLQELADWQGKGGDIDIFPLLSSIYNAEVAEAGTEAIINTPDGNMRFEYVAPDLNKLPRIPESRNLCELYSAIDFNVMMCLYASLMHERRVLVLSKKLGRVSSCVHAAASLIYPMTWQHIFIPLLPGHLIDTLSAPMPYLIGMHASLLEKVNRSELEEVVILDLDARELQTETNDLENMPDEVVTSLRRRLRGLQNNKPGAAVHSGDEVSRAFLKATVAIIGGYRDALTLRPGEDNIVFDSEKFVQGQSSHMQKYLEQMLHLQIFQEFMDAKIANLNEQFVNERIDNMIDESADNQDEFEKEVTLAREQQNVNAVSYNQIVGTMKKQGKKLQRGSRDMWSGLKTKVKDKSRTAVRGIKHKFADKKEDMGSQGSLNKARQTVTLPSHPLRTERPPRPPPPAKRSASSEDLPSPTGVRKYELLDLSDVAAAHVTRSSNDVSVELRHTEGAGPTAAVKDMRRVSSDVDLKHLSLDLMTDPMIQRAIQKTYAREEVEKLISLDEDDDSNEAEQESPVLRRPSASRPVPAVRYSLYRKTSSSGEEGGEGGLANSAFADHPPDLPAKRGLPPRAISEDTRLSGFEDSFSVQSPLTSLSPPPNPSTTSLIDTSSTHDTKTGLDVTDPGLTPNRSSHVSLLAAELGDLSLPSTPSSQTSQTPSLLDDCGGTQVKRQAAFRGEGKPEVLVRPNRIPSVSPSPSPITPGRRVFASGALTLDPFDPIAGSISGGGGGGNLFDVPLSQKQSSVVGNGTSGTATSGNKDLDLLGNWDLSSTLSGTATSSKPPLPPPPHFPSGYHNPGWGGSPRLPHRPAPPQVPPRPFGVQTPPRQSFRGSSSPQSFRKPGPSAFTNSTYSSVALKPVGSASSLGSSGSGGKPKGESKSDPFADLIDVKAHLK